ncbi:MAG: two-component system, chemotaxis family, CheB/CheR fusion protein [Solirubrobacteraceae bacterium]
MTDGSALDVLLDYLKRTRGFDFTGYKRTTLGRRVAKRMEAVGVDSHAAYVDFLEVHPDEFAFLFNTILINVTGFFRDHGAWDYLITEVVPRALEGNPEGPFRVWCAGCASGEETYSLAMVLAEALGEEQYLQRVKIYGTDVDEEALTEARHASYSATAVEAVPTELRERYFERVEQRYAFRKHLRRAVIFGRNDLVQDAPISRIDLLTCRNTLMYFNAETQAQILGRFHFALNDWGYLYLGKSEMLITHSDLFKPVSVQRRVFTKVARPTLRDRLLFTVAANDGDVNGTPGSAAREGAFDAAPVAQIAVDAGGDLILANENARSLFGLSINDVGRPLKDLEISYRPVDLRSNIEMAHTDRRGIALTQIAMTTPRGDPRELEVLITPLYTGEQLLGTTVTYADVTPQRRLQKELEGSKHELETAYEELQSTVEELETTNEELQSTNEELETTNEELQSSNEELETMNEELQSTNEELETINEELRQRSLELDEVNAFLETILTSLGVAIIVLDNDLSVRVWNAGSTDLWGVRADEAEGHHLLGLDLGLPVERLKVPLRKIMRDGQDRIELVLEATNRRGKQIECKVVALPFSVDGNEARGAILIMEEMPQPAAS